MTKSEAIQKTKEGWTADHPQTGGFMRLVVSFEETASKRVETRDVYFYGNCSPKDGWQADWLGAR